MEGDEDSFCILQLLEPTHSFESYIEVTDVRLKSVRGCGNARVDEVREGVVAGILEAPQDVLVDGIQPKDIGYNETFQMFPAQEESVRRGIQEKLAVAIENALLCIPRMAAESLELQSGLEVSKQVNVTALHVCAVRFKHLCEAGQAINRRCCEDGASLQHLLQKVIEDLWRFFAGTQFPCEEPRCRVPDQMLAVLLPTNAEGFAIQNEDAAW